MNKLGQFVSDVITGVLKLKISCKQFEIKYQSRSIFYMYTVRDSVFLGDACAYALNDTIMTECDGNENKKLELIKYFKSYLEHNEVGYFNDENLDFDNLVGFVISKFTHPNNKDFSAKIDKKAYKLVLDDTENKYITAKKIKELYKKALDYKSKDVDVVFIYAKSITETIYRYIANENGKSDIVGYIDSLLPTKIAVSIKNIDNTLDAIDAGLDKQGKEELIESFIHSLQNVVVWFIKIYLNCDEVELKNFDISKKFMPHEDKIINKIRAIDAVDLMKIKKCTLEEIVTTTIALDYDSIEDLDKVEQHTVNQWVSVVNKFPETWKIICDDEYNIVGYWHFLVMYDDNYQKAKEGEIIDSDIKLDMMPLLIPGVYNVYFMIICIKEEYQKTYVFKVMIDSILKQLENMAVSGVFVDEICALAYSDSGLALCKSIGLKFYKKHTVHGDIYCGNVFDLLDKHFCREFVRLKELYRNM